MEAVLQAPPPGTPSSEAQPSSLGTTIHSLNASSPLVSKRKQRSIAKPAPPSTAVRTAHQILVEGDDGGIEMLAACTKLQAAIDARSHYKMIDKGQSESVERLPHSITVVSEEGVFNFVGQTTKVVPWEMFYDDVMAVMQAVESKHCKATCKYRLHILEEKHNLYRILNADLEESADRNRRGGGFFAHSTKVDNCIHLQTCANALQLIEYVQSAVEDHAEDVVRLVSDKPQTLHQMFAALDIEDPAELTVDNLGLHPSTEKRFDRFDVFDPELNRAGKASADFVRLFLSMDTLNGGQYFADVVRPIF